MMSRAAPDDYLTPPSADRASSIPAAQTASAQNAARLGGLLPERCAAAPVFSNVEHARLPLLPSTLCRAPNPYLSQPRDTVHKYFVRQEKRWACFGL